MAWEVTDVNLLKLREIAFAKNTVDSLQREQMMTPEQADVAAKKLGTKAKSVMQLYLTSLDA